MVLRDLAPLHRLSQTEALDVAEAQAEALLRLLAVVAPPVPEERLAAIPLVQVERVTPTEAMAATQWSHGRWLILVNGAARLGRQRWSLAHEFKHILDHPMETILYAKDAHELREQVCDYFAGCLLVPRKWLRAAWRSGTRDQGALAKRFGVSRKAIRIRLLQVGLVDAKSHYIVKEV
ncbi:MAG: ImmA/IrrE family metallo-endopeptidase [Kineosporiaceae bacterium]|nr:ImmA/IrrE family metallo-endopeptidase [Kineosporiaceae bacterium]MBK8077586.1 ImmA/IrrE family metallo-endopeptidase [Kineosporiaceae bacterium]